VPDLPDPTATAFYEDGAGHVWMGSYKGILMRYEGSHWRTISEPHGWDTIGALHGDRQGRIWVSHQSGAVDRIDEPSADDPRIVHIPAPPNLSRVAASGIAEDQWGRIYIGTPRGVDNAGCRFSIRSAIHDWG
jgi:ligand-binding sensor domain-containing protein